MKYNLSKFKINSQFFYNKNFNLEFFNDYFVTNINLKKANQKNIENLITGISSSLDNSYIYLSTSSGDFLFLSLKNYLKTNYILDTLQTTSKNSSSFYFYSNTNNLTARFGFYENGKLVNFISKTNSEYEDPDNEIEWISNSNEINQQFNISNNQANSFNFDIINQMVDYFLPEKFNNVEFFKIAILHKSDSKLRLSETLNIDLFKKRHIDKLSSSSLNQAHQKLLQYEKNDFFITVDANKHNVYLHSFLLSEISDSEFLFLNTASKLYKSDEFIAYEFNNSIVSMIDEIKHCEIKNINFISKFIKKIPNDTKRFILSFNFLKNNKFTITLLHFPNGYPIDIYSCNKFNVKTAKEILDFVINLSPIDVPSDY